MQNSANQAQPITADWLCLVRAPGIGAKRARQLLSVFADASAVRAASAQQLRDLKMPQTGIEYLHAETAAEITAELQWLEQDGIAAIPCTDTRFPSQLNQLSDAPVLLYVRGDAQLLQLPALAIVGSRNPSRDGVQLAEQFAAALAEAGLCIVSGLAVGIDGAAHRGALAAGGLTIAVCGTSLERVYPARHRQLAVDIAKQGALVAEFPYGSASKRGNFPRRNLTLSGLSVGTLVIEAARQSGSLITARLAMEQGREVFAVPGSIHNPLARGCHDLIRQGAKLVENADHILEEIAAQLDIAELQQRLNSSNPIDKTAASKLPEPASESLQNEYQNLLQHMGNSSCTVDELVNCSGLTADAISSMLLILELDGHVENRPGGGYQRLRYSV